MINHYHDLFWIFRHFLSYTFSSHGVFNLLLPTNTVHKVIEALVDSDKFPFKKICCNTCGATSCKWVKNRISYVG